MLKRRKGFSRVRQNICLCVCWYIAWATVHCVGYCNTYTCMMMAKPIKKKSESSKGFTPSQITECERCPNHWATEGLLVTTRSNSECCVFIISFFTWTSVQGEGKWCQENMIQPGRIREVRTFLKFFLFSEILCNPLFLTPIYTTLNKVFQSVVNNPQFFSCTVFFRLNNLWKSWLTDLKTWILEQ